MGNSDTEVRERDGALKMIDPLLGRGAGWMQRATPRSFREGDKRVEATAVVENPASGVCGSPVRAARHEAARPLALEDHPAEPAGEQGQKHADHAVEEWLLHRGQGQEALEADLAHGKAFRAAGNDLAILEHIG